ncbi:hypothetical protein [Lachnoclostridium sp. An138]|uniref:hypothetical protein n=1 Tax=Lachnoclostridium sp. An138 TaxID=1965560 RepID=UPI000B38A9CF|nr:hypothetical protein [Lachnoclostridium sp. An138]OUQ19566.1 hypothetical protein B5E82_04945 [Lachnoclostridium sp. An138]
MSERFAEILRKDLPANLSLLYSQDLKGVRLAPAYDVVSTAIYESSTKEMALSIGGIHYLRSETG